MREWLTVIIVVLILGILLDGWRRMRNARRDTLKVSRSIYRPKPSDKPQAPDAPERSPFSSELPNGGARVVGSRTPGAEAVRKETSSAPKTVKSEVSRSATVNSQQGSEPTSDPLDPGWENAEPEVQPESAWSATSDAGIKDADHYDNEARDTEHHEPEERDVELEHAPVRRAEPEEESARIPQQVTLNLDESVPLLMESLEDEEPESEPARPYSATSRPQQSQSSKDPAHQGSMASDSGIENVEHQIESDDERIEPTLGSEANLGGSGFDLDAPQTQPLNPNSEAAVGPAPSAVQEEEPGEPEEVLIINVMARPGHYFQGEPLLQEIFDAGMRYGSMSIFHRYRDARGGGPVLFSLANMVKPGIFDLDAMEQFQTPGVSLFMTLPMPGDSLEAFELMLDTAKGIAETLHGELKDEHRSVMTKQTMEHDRQRVLEFERRQLSRAH